MAIEPAVIGRVFTTWSTSHAVSITRSPVSRFAFHKPKGTGAKKMKMEERGMKGKGNKGGEGEPKEQGAQERIIDSGGVEKPWKINYRAWQKSGKFNRQPAHARL